MEKIFSLSIITAAYNNRDDLICLLNSISKYSTPSKSLTSNIEVWVIDDGSTPPLRDIVLPYGFNYYYQKNKGPAAARNQGARLANGEAFLFLDSDTVLLPDTLSRVLNITRRPDFKVVSLPYYPKSINKGWASEFKGLFDAYNVWYKHPLGPTEALNGASVLFQRDAFFKTGGWDENFDTPDVEHEEFSTRIKKIYPIIFHPDVFVYHRFPKFKKLLISIFFRTMSWTRLKIKGKIGFDDITRTKSKGVIAVIPLIILLITLLGLFNHFFFWMLIPAICVYFICNIPFYRFLVSNSTFLKAFIYAWIHFMFLLSVGLGAAIGAVTFWKSKV